VINLMDALRRSLEDAKPPAQSKPRQAAAKPPVKPAATPVEPAKRKRQARSA
jgi:DNA end-binding protein Ku